MSLTFFVHMRMLIDRLVPASGCHRFLAVTPTRQASRIRLNRHREAAGPYRYAAEVADPGDPFP